MKLTKLFVAVVFAAMWNTSYAQEEPKSTLEQVMEKMEPRNIGPAGMSGRVTCIAVHPTVQPLFTRERLVVVYG